LFVEVGNDHPERHLGDFQGVQSQSKEKEELQIRIA
jgi:hypothetical protein